MICRLITLLLFNVYFRTQGTIISCRKFLLGVGLFEQRAPELVVIGRMYESQASVDRRQPIVDDDFRPSAEHPEPETEGTAVALRLVECLVIWRRSNLVEQVGELTQTGHGGDEPTVS